MSSFLLEGKNSVETRDSKQKQQKIILSKSEKYTLEAGEWALETGSSPAIRVRLAFFFLKMVGSPASASSVI